MKKYFSIDSRTILTLGRDSIKDHSTAILELIKNSYDADATEVEVEIIDKAKNRYIRIADNGCGMTEKEVDKFWLRIGYSEKRSNKYSKLNRRKTGEKGIGRISADRLGAILELRTKTSKSKTYCLKVNWDDFNIEGKDLTTIPIEVTKNSSIKIPKNKNGFPGTELIITKLRQAWTKKDIENLYNELSILIPPFKKVIDFDILLKTDIAHEFNGKIKSPFYENAQIELDAGYDGEIIWYRVKDRYPPNKSKVFRKSMIKWQHLVQKYLESPNEIKYDYPRFGPVELKILFYPRIPELLEGSEFRLSDLRDFLDKNAGFRIYRDNIRVKPYGDPKEPEGDWLGLAERKTREPAAIKRPTWVVSANQIIGAAFLSRDTNPMLVDSSSREGLIQGDAFYELRSFVLGCLRLLELHRHRREKERKLKEEKKESPSQEITYLNKELTLLQKDLKSLSDQVPQAAHRPIKRTMDQLITVSEKIKYTKHSLEELISESRVFRGLATIGIAAAVFGHETQSSIDEFIGAVYAATSVLNRTPNKVDLIENELKKAQKYAEQVSSWGAFALSRVQRDKRQKRKINISNIINEVIMDINSIFIAANIEIQTELEAIEANSFAMDIEAIILNLLTNAYYACQQNNRKRVIKFILKDKSFKDVDGFVMIVSDTGPGIDLRFKERIWDPLFTTKVNREGKQYGTGLGLTIVQSIVNDFKGDKQVDKDPKLGGARFKIWLPKK